MIYVLIKNKAETRQNSAGSQCGYEFGPGKYGQVGFSAGADLDPVLQVGYKPSPQLGNPEPFLTPVIWLVTLLGWHCRVVHISLAS
jgi:hypothetical protein